MKKWMALFLALTVCLLPVWSSVADTVRISAPLTQRISTRTGPSTAYDEPGTFFSSTWRNEDVTVLSKDYGSGVWWVQIEFRSQGKLYRAYTGVKRVDVDLNWVPQESVIGQGHMSAAGSVAAYYGPGTQYAVMAHDVPWDIDVDIIEAENGWLLVDFFDDDVGTQRRAWVPSNVVSAQWYGSGRPAESVLPSESGLKTGDTFYWTENSYGSCTIAFYGAMGGYSLIDLNLPGYVQYDAIAVSMDGADYGTFTTRDGRTGDIWFYANQIVIDMGLQDVGINELLIFTR